MTINKEDIGDDILFLIEGVEVEIQTYEGQIVGIELPKTVDLTVEECPPFIKGATATNKPKPATLETGLVILVPNFIVPGEKLKASREGNLNFILLVQFIIQITPLRIHFIKNSQY